MKKKQKRNVVADGFEYLMSVAAYNDLAADCKGQDLQKYAVDYVNDQLGLKGTCVKVSAI